MKGLGLLALLIIVALLYGGMTNNRSSSSTANTSAAGLPTAFVSSEQGQPNRSIKAVFNLEPTDNYVAKPWPFTTRRIHFACAEGALTVVQVNSRFAALNGHTSGLNRLYQIRDDRGGTFPIISASNNQNFRDAGIILSDADDSTIGEWWSALNKRLLRECGN